MSRTVERLSQHGWVARHPDPTDHRACLVSITEAGTELLDAVRREGAGRPATSNGSPREPITAVLVGVAGLTLLVKAGGGLYSLIPAAMASLAGGVSNAWLFLVRLTSES